MRRLFKPKLTKLTLNSSDDLSDFPLYEDIDDTSRDVLGISSDGAIVCADRDIFNKLVIGVSGSGKTQSAVKTGLWQSLKNEESVVVCDTKGDLYKETARVFKEKGYEIKILDLRPSERPNSDGFNPIALIQPGNPDNELIANVISDCLLKAYNDPEGYRGVWWQQKSYLLKSLVLYFGTDPAEIEAGHNNIPSIYDFISTYDISEYEKIFCKNREPSDPVVVNIREFLKNEDSVKGQIVNATGCLIQQYGGGHIRQILSHNEIDVRLPKKRKCIYYIESSEMDHSCNPILSIFYTLCLIKQREHDTASSQIVHYIIDEYQQGGAFDLDLVSTSHMRVQKAKGTFIFQDMVQVESICGDHMEDFLRSCDYKILLGSYDARTIRYFRELTDKIDPGKNYDTENIGRNEALIVKSDMFMVLKKYFSEISAEPVHPLEKRAQTLGFVKISKHIPEWRKELEENV